MVFGRCLSPTSLTFIFACRSSGVTELLLYTAIYGAQAWRASICDTVIGCNEYSHICEGLTYYNEYM